jgi:hypothetical protein
MKFITMKNVPKQFGLLPELSEKLPKVNNWIKRRKFAKSGHRVGSPRSSTAINTIEMVNRRPGSKFVLNF